MRHPELPPNVVVLPGTDVEGEWERFRVFEALHHGMTICNPMLPADLDALVMQLDPVDGERVLDLACGHGELLMRMAERAQIAGVGVDLSPWVIARAASTAMDRQMQGEVEWRVGEARNAADAAQWDIVTCLGASWIWHGTEGTVRALARRCRPGARVAMGDLVLREGVDGDEVAATVGRKATGDETAAMFEAAGFEDIAELTLDETGWHAYQERIWESAHEWRRLHPGAEADTFIAEQERWRLDHDRDMELLRWAVWAARRPRVG